MLNGGGSVYPSHFQYGSNYGTQCEQYFGMSLRDKFADTALRELIHSAAYRDDGSMQPSVELIAKVAYRAADAMLAERKKGKGGE